MIPNVPDFPRAYFGILAAGGVVVPVHALLTAEEVAYVLRDSGAKLVLCAAPLLASGATRCCRGRRPVLLANGGRRRRSAPL